MFRSKNDKAHSCLCIATVWGPIHNYIKGLKLDAVQVVAAGEWGEADEKEAA